MKKILFILAAAAGVVMTSCSDACDYTDSNTNNPSFVQGYNDSTKVSHPETLAGTVWTRGAGIKVNAYGQDIQGFVESLDFYREDSVIVKMSEGSTKGTWVNDGNTEANPAYFYTYSSVTGAIDIKKTVIDGKKVTQTTLFLGTAVSGTKEVITMSHFGDTPSQTYLVKK